MKILAFAGSNSSTSINKQLVKFVTTHFPKDEVNLLDINDFEVPVFSEDREKNGTPEKIHDFLKHIESCDFIICSFPEHNRTFSVAFKNILDWSSRVDRNVFKKKKMFLMSTSPGAFGGARVMEFAKSVLPEFGADIIDTFSLPKFHENFDTKLNQLTNKELRDELEGKIEKFKASIA